MYFFFKFLSLFYYMKKNSKKLLKNWFNDIHKYKELIIKILNVLFISNSTTHDTIATLI